MKKKKHKALSPIEALELVFLNFPRYRITPKNSLYKEVMQAINAYKEPKETKILITVEGGIVQSVLSNNTNIEFVVVDYDMKGDEPVIVSKPEIPEQLKPEHFYELFNDKSDPVEMEVRDKLKDHKF